MRYKVTCLTPTLVGDGQRLSPIDYMVWKDHVNVLDQRRIFRLLAKGPRLDGYLAQLRKAEKLDFANWGGFAQNFAGRRIPFEHPSLAAIWEKQRADALFIPTFAAGASGPYLPASALRGALHTALLFSRWTDGTWKQVVDRMQGDRPPRRPADVAEDQALGGEGYNRLRSFGVADSRPVDPGVMKVYLVRVATMVPRGGGRLELGWKVIGRGAVDSKRIDESATAFCEMAVPGAGFEGDWLERKQFADPELLKQLRWKHPLDFAAVREAANRYAEKLIGIHRHYAAVLGLKAVEESLGDLELKLNQARANHGCLLSIGWGGGFLAKVSYLSTEEEGYKRLLQQLPFYSRAFGGGTPFPKTRRVVFMNGQPAALPGWVLLETQ